VGVQPGLVVEEQVLALAHKQQAAHLRVDMLQIDEQAFLQGMKQPK
jgi:hypothetical protein